MITLYYARGTCALASHLALEYAGAEYRTVRIDFAKKEQRSPEYLRLNPKGRVPALLTEPGAQLPGVPPDHRPGRPAARTERRCHAGDGMRQGHRRVRRGAALPVLGFSTRQFCGPPRRCGSQAFTLELALQVLESAPAPRTTVQSPLRWSADADWKLDYSNVERLTPAEIRPRRGEFDRGKAEAKAKRQAR